MALLGLLAYDVETHQAVAEERPASVAEQSSAEIHGLPSLAPLVDRVKPAVVNVEVDKQRRRAEMFQRPGGEGSGAGSGFIVDPRGLVVTNYHVVADSTRIQVRLPDGRSFEGEVAGRDPLTDVALIRLKGEVSGLPAVGLGDSSKLRPGDWVVAIGSPFGLAQSVSAGIISALDRQIRLSRFDQFLQTDAAINPGNSGGPLFNLRGEVVGMNTAILGNASGIGFAVPSNVIKSIMGQLEQKGFVARGFLGVGLQDFTPALEKALGISEGAIIADVTDGSPAEGAGLKSDDVIYKFNGEKIPNSTTLTRRIGGTAPGTSVKLTIRRGKESKEVSLRLGSRQDVEPTAEQPKRAAESPSEPAATPKRIGFAYRTITPELARSHGLSAPGVVVVDVANGSLAEQAGLAPGMVIIEAQRQAVNTQQELAAILKAAGSKSPMLFRVVLPRSQGQKRLIAFEMP